MRLPRFEIRTIDFDRGPKLASLIAWGYLYTAYCLLPTAYCLLPTAYCLLPTAYCLLPTAYCLLPTDEGAVCEMSNFRFEQ